MLSRTCVLAAFWLGLLGLLNAQEPSLSIQKAVLQTPKRSTALVTAPAPFFPFDGFLLGDFTTTLRWTNPVGATQNHLEVIPANNDGPGINLIFNAADTYPIPPPPEWYGLLPDMTYTWKVRATDATVALGVPSPAWGPWSRDSTFRTPKVSGGSIVLTSPAQGETANSTRPFLQWSESNSRIFYYEVQLSKDPTFDNDPATATAAVYWELRHGGMAVPVNSYRLPEGTLLEEQTIYYWRVRPRVQGDGAPVEWSPQVSFLVKSAPPLPDLPGPLVPGGTVTLQQVTVPAGAVVTASRATTLVVNGPVNIQGTLVSQRAEISILARGDISIAGQIDTSGTGTTAGAGVAQFSPSSNGGSITLQSEGSITIAGSLQTGSGGGAAAPAVVQRLTSAGRVLQAAASPSGNGGSVRIMASKDVVLAAGAAISTGTGAPGGGANVAATSVTDRLEALGGKGGGGGDIVLQGTNLQLPSSGAVFSLGNGGAGGAASSTGLTRNGRASGARNVGGAGGNGGVLQLDPALPVDRYGHLLAGGKGGRGGDATATLTPATITAVAESHTTDPVHGASFEQVGGDGGAGTEGGNGGNASSPTAGDGFDGGHGGHSVAIGGRGGRITTPSDAGQAGRGADAEAGLGGHGSTSPDGRTVGNGGDSRAFGGAAGLDTVRLRSDLPGGSATARDGGRGGNAGLCPAGRGGNGGASWAEGGPGWPGGNATAGRGGDGGRGATCCTPSPGLAGGPGGDGGWSSAEGGNGLSHPTRGGNGGNAFVPGAGSGGRGGDGRPPGGGGAPGRQQAAGGAGGQVGGRPGTEILPSSPPSPGAPGQLCPLEQPTATPTSGIAPPPTPTWTPTPASTPTTTTTPTLRLSCVHRIPGVESDVIIRGENFPPGKTVSGQVTGPGVVGSGRFCATAGDDGRFEARVPINRFGTYTVTVDSLSSTINVGATCPG